MRQTQQNDMNKYYRLDSRKLSYGEYWNMTCSWKVIIPWAAKLLGIPMKLGSGMPHFESVRELEVAEADFSEQAREQLQSLLDTCLAMGFRAPRYFTYETMLRTTRISFIALLHGSGATVRLMHSQSSLGTIAKEKIAVVLLSELRDGTYFYTCDQRPQFRSAPGILANPLVGARPEQLLEAHLQKLAEFQAGNPAKPVDSAEQLDDAWDRSENRSREFGMQRGIYVWMTPEEVAAEQQALTAATAQAGAGGENVDVLLALHQLQNKTSSWGSMIVILIVSLALFVGAGVRQSSWSYLFIVLGVLFVHELGHFLAMRVFDYRNVRMFFIPFFGAAVSGQHYNVAGWKKVVVSLMGPVPGIVLGVILGVAGMVLDQPVLLKVAVVSLLLNGFNLLPLLPLDGGRVFHTLLFSRHCVLDAVFRVVAAIALIVGGPLLEMKFLMYLGIVMLIGVPASYRAARIAAGLRERGLPPALPGEQTIPTGTAQAIIAEVKRATDKPQSNTTIAQQTLQIFETLNARPPGWAATIGLLFIHAASLGAAAVFALVFIVAQRHDLRDLSSGNAEMPDAAPADTAVPPPH